MFSNIYKLIKCCFFRATNPVFKNVAQKICDVFPSEVMTTYYKSPIKKKDNPAVKKMSIPSSGKLPTKWRNCMQLWKVENAADSGQPKDVLEPEDKGEGNWK